MIITVTARHDQAATDDAGDGTLNLAAAAVMRAKRPLGVLPLGTANDFARTLLIPTELEAACRNVVEGVTHGVDLGQAMKKERTTDAPAKEPEGWSVPVLTTNALTNEGVEKLLDTISEHRVWLEESGEIEQRRRARAAIRIRDVVDREMRRVAWKSDDVQRLLREGVEEISAGDGTPYSAADVILGTLLR